jgi:hypothetical protein
MVLEDITNLSGAKQMENPPGGDGWETGLRVSRRSAGLRQGGRAGVGDRVARHLNVLNPDVDRPATD